MTIWSSTFDVAGMSMDKWTFVSQAHHTLTHNSLMLPQMHLNVEHYQSNCRNRDRDRQHSRLTVDNSKPRSALSLSLPLCNPLYIRLLLLLSFFFVLVWKFIRNCVQCQFVWAAAHFMLLLCLCLSCKIWNANIVYGIFCSFFLWIKENENAYRCITFMHAFEANKMKRWKRASERAYQTKRTMCLACWCFWLLENRICVHIICNDRFWNMHTKSRTTKAILSLNVRYGFRKSMYCCTHWFGMQSKWRAPNTIKPHCTFSAWKANQRKSKRCKKRNNNNNNETI